MERRPVARREVPVVALGQVGPGGGELAHLGHVAGNGGVMQRWLRPRRGALGQEQFGGFCPEIFVGVVERRPAAVILRVDAEPGVEQLDDPFVHAARGGGVQQRVAGPGDDVKIRAAVAQELRRPLVFADDSSKERRPAGVGFWIHLGLAQEQRGDGRGATAGGGGAERRGAPAGLGLDVAAVVK